MFRRFAAHFETYRNVQTGGSKRPRGSIPSGPSGSETRHLEREGRNGAGSHFDSRFTWGHANDLFEVFGTTGAARFDLSRNPEFGFLDNSPSNVTNGWRRVVVGAEHLYVAAAQSMPFTGIGHGGQEFFTYQARAFLDTIVGLTRLPAPATFADGLCNLIIEEAIVTAAVSDRTAGVGA